MAILEKTVRSAALAVAALFIGLSLFGMLGVWLLNGKVAEIAHKGFGLVEAAAGVIDSGAARVHDLIATSRTEVRQASETITAVAPRAQENTPVLSALNERLETSLAPRITQIQQALGPVRDAVGTIGNAVSLLNSLPTIADHAPRLATLDGAFNRLEALSADTTQLRGTLRALVAEQKSGIAPETVAALSELSLRIDTRLGEVQASVQGVRGEIAALKVRLDARKTRMIFVFDLLATSATPMLSWIIYSQFVVIRHYQRSADGGSFRGQPRSELVRQRHTAPEGSVCLTYGIDSVARCRPFLSRSRGCIPPATPRGMICKSAL